jgi:glycosyltransferase, MGT family
MSGVLFINGNVHGHINPTIALVKELVARGEKVDYYSTEEFRSKIEATGARFKPYGGKLDSFLRNYRAGGNHPFFTLVEFILKMDEQIVSIVLDNIKDKEYDYIIHDSMFGGGLVLSAKLGIPAVCSSSSFAANGSPMPPHMLAKGFHPQLDSIYCEIERLSKAWDIDFLSIDNIFFKKEKLNIVYTSQLFQPDSGSLDETFKFIGPSFEDRHEAETFPLHELDEQKVIYISMGTINNKCLDFYRNCLQAFSGSVAKVVMSVGKKVDIKDLGEIPDNFIIRNYVPQLEVLKNTDVFISHGGLNSVSESLYYSVPIVAIPQANDQPMVAKRLVELGAGVSIKMEEATPQFLKEKSDMLLENDSYKEAAQRIGKSFREAGGYKAGADYIMDFVNRKKGQVHCNSL